MMKYYVSDTITEFRTYEVEADSYEDAAELVEQHATDKPEDLTGGLVLVDRGITDRFQQDETLIRAQSGYLDSLFKRIS